ELHPDRSFVSSAACAVGFLTRPRRSLKPTPNETTAQVARTSPRLLCVYAMTTAQLADHIAIEEQLSRYCRAIDTGEWDLLDGIFTADAVLDYTSSGGIRGTFAEVKPWLAKVLPLFAVR